MNPQTIGALDEKKREALEKTWRKVGVAGAAGQQKVVQMLGRVLQHAGQER